MTIRTWRNTLRLTILLLCAGCAAASKSAAPKPPVPTSSAADLGDVKIVAIAPAPGPAIAKPTLPEFLGLHGMCKALGGAAAHLFSRLVNALDLEGRLPALEPQPPLLPISDPANMSDDAPPAVKAAAEAKAEEDQAPQKIQALRYLATLGCGGCYDKVEDALLMALEDCTESVRYEAVAALRGKTSNTRPCCVYCKSDCCCSDKIRTKLNEIATKQNDKGQYKEPSERVRRMARVALDACGGPPPAKSSETPLEGPEGPQPTPAVAANTPSAPPNPTPTVKTGVSRAGQLIADVALVVFNAPSGAAPPNDVELARVNGELIYDHEVAPLVQAELARLKEKGRILDPVRTRELLKAEVQRAIDIKLVLQRARQELATGETPDGATDLQWIESWLTENLRVSDNVTMLELTQEFAAQQQRFAHPARVRWERITVDVRRCGGRDQAYVVMAYLRGRASGQSPAAPDFDRQAVETRTFGWTTAPEFPSLALSRTAFSLPLGKPSAIIEERDHLHLVRVLERQPAGIESFETVVDTLRREILERRQGEAEREFVRRLRQGAQISTVFDSDPQSPDASAAVRPAGSVAPAETTISR